MPHLKSSFSSHLGKPSTSNFLISAAHITNSERNLHDTKAALFSMPLSEEPPRSCF